MTQIKCKTADGTNYYNSDIPVSNYKFLTENGLSVVDWNGNTVILPSYDRQNAETATYTSKDSIEAVDIKMQSEYVHVDYETPANSKVYILNGIYTAKMICNQINHSASLNYLSIIG